jgi:hypothetical protein
MKKLLLSLLCLMFVSQIAITQSNQVLSLNGSGSYVTLGSTYIGPFTNQITLEAWIKIEAVPTMVHSQVFSTGNQNDFTLDIKNDMKVGGYFYPLGELYSKTPIILNTWTHVCEAYDGSSRKLYINGVLDTQIVLTGNIGGSPQIDPPIIGAHYSQPNNEFFNGKIDELRIWNITRTQSQIQSNIYQPLQINDRTGLRGYWRFEGNLVDSSGYYPLGTPVGSPTIIFLNAPYWSKGKSVDFTNQGAIRVPKTNSSLNITGNTITVEALIKPTSSGANWGRIFIGGDVNSTYTMTEYSSNPIRIIWRPLGGTNNNLSSKSSLISNVWYHIAGTYDGSTSRIYINGALDTSFSMTGNIPLNNNAAWIGGDLGSPLSYLYSRLDEIRVWNVVRTQTQLQQNSFKELPPTDTAGLVGYWKLNNNAKDYSNRGNDGYLCGSAQFDTANSVALLPTTPTLISPSNHSINVSFTPTLFWNTVSGAINYKVQVSTNTGFTNIVDSATVSTNQRTIPAGKLNLASTYYWRVNATNANGTGNWSEVWDFTTIITGVQKITSEIPNEYKLYNNYPNPFNPVTNIKFDMPKSSDTKITVYDLQGKEVGTLINQKIEAGSYSVDWNASNFSSGIYFYSIKTDYFSDTKKMILLK